MDPEAGAKQKICCFSQNEDEVWFYLITFKTTKKGKTQELGHNYRYKVKEKNKWRMRLWHIYDKHHRVGAATRKPYQKDIIETWI